MARKTNASKPAARPTRPSRKPAGSAASGAGPKRSRDSDSRQSKNAFGQRELTDSQLTEGMVPSSRASLDKLMAFALSFNGYKYWGDTQSCAAIANPARAKFKGSGQLPTALTDLRTCLFFEQRRYHHFGHPPNKEGERYLRALVDAIRNQVRAGGTRK